MTINSDKSMANLLIRGSSVLAVIYCGLLALSGCQMQSQSIRQTLTNDAAEEADSFGKAQKLLRQRDQPLRAYAVLERLSITQKPLLQVATQFHAFLGRERLTQGIWEQAYPITGQTLQPSSIAAADLRPLDALQEIATQAESKRIVILNENHASQRQRAFAFELAMALRKKGFTHLGLEALTSDLSAEVIKAGIATTAGLYTNDPLLADLIRQSSKQGYTIFAYDHHSGSTADPNLREKFQAENIKKVLDADPSAKVFLYVGFGHGSKSTVRSSLKVLGQRLVEMMENEVYSIDQFKGVPASQPSLDTPIYQAVARTLLHDRATVFRRQSGELLSSKGFDVEVFHPRTAEIHGRGTWMTMKGYRKLHEINIAPLPARTLVRARTLPLQKGGVAMDQVLINSLETQAALFLPIGEYELFRESETGVAEKMGRVTVK